MSRQTPTKKPLASLRLELNAPATAALVMEIGKLFQDALIETEWVKQPDGSLLMNLRATQALTTTDFHPLTGREYLEDFSDALDPDAAEAFMASVESEL